MLNVLKSTPAVLVYMHNAIRFSGNCCQRSTRESSLFFVFLLVHLLAAEKGRKTEGFVHGHVKGSFFPPSRRPN